MGIRRSGLTYQSAESIQPQTSRRQVMAEPETPEQLVIRFRGICGHIDLPNGKTGNSKKKKKRTVLVSHHNGNMEIEHHIPYIEVLADDVESFTSGLNVVQYSRPGVDGRLARVELDNATLIKLRDIEPGYVEEEISYRNDVPHMKDVVGQPNAAMNLQTPEAKDINTDHVVAVFDMPEGRLVAGDPEPAITRFATGIPFKPRRLARWSDLYSEYTPPLVVELVRLGSDVAKQEITFHKTLRMITIGNEPERLILGVGKDAHGNHAGHPHSVSPVQLTGHYLLYYDLLEKPPKPDERPVPIPTQFDGSGCPNSNYP
jgi:hypothetical protein